jgi:peroxiredoxin
LRRDVRGRAAAGPLGRALPASVLCLLAACASELPARTALPADGEAPPAAGTLAPGATDATAVAAPRVETFTARLDSSAPDFELQDLEGRMHSLARYAGRIVVLEWLEPECPEVRWAYAEGPLREQPLRLAAQGVVWLAVHSGSASEEALREFARAERVTHPILLDRGGLLCRAYGAQVAPTCCVINERGVLVYRGALDNAPFGKVGNNGPRFNLVDAAIADLRSGHALRVPKSRPYGCPIRAEGRGAGGVDPDPDPN